MAVQLVAPIIGAITRWFAGTAFGTWIIGLFALIGWKIAVAFGVGVVAYVGFDALIDDIVNRINADLSGLAGDGVTGDILYQMYGLLNADIIVNATVAGFLTKLTIQGLVGGVVGRLSFNPLRGG